ncbi:MFS/sugar transport protein [Longilinea arvoryzae]|uniref:MFS/sugar transport protein n=1 Tax=Longilinea arvoryzae TaxID=360412 RepID=A0A0S7BHM2_9CHLR|nr:MFS transporter [Longilinea arvoryzae]GAP13018.1 MFS/sugar transport protein [Longilinea arvoryzae]
MSNSPSSSTRITPRAWFVMAALAITGQIAWAVENSWFNTFVYDTITPDPRPVAWMVACSAITATLTTLLMGTLSDRAHTRWGRRRPFILFGYICWGISTILFPTVAYIKVTSVAVVMVVLADSLMTFFGSTANDAAFNAWTADIAASDQRGRVEGVLNLSVFIAQIVAMVAAGMLIDSVGYFIFFYALGAIVLVVGWVAGSLLREPPQPAVDVHQRSFWAEFGELFSLDTLRQNRALFILLLFIMITSIGMQISFPYMIVYLLNYVGITKTDFSIVGGAVMVGSALVAIPFGMLADRWNKRAMMAIALVVSSLGGILLSLVKTLPLLATAGFLWQGFAVAVSVASVAWLKDLLPEQNRGKFLGIRMIFWIAIPMIIGPAIGSALIQAYGIPTVSNGEAGFIPVPIIFQVGSLVSLLGLLPLFFTGKKHANRLPSA